ncbi:MAG: beta-galactosidase [Ruminococcus sp.]|nr:beta-galactosidase [Ruminococcus sp.]
MAALTPKFPHMLHGGDYNPDQWRDRQDILEEDVRLFKAAGINTVSLGIFAWSAIEPEKDRFEFEWLDEVIDRLWKNGIYVDLATPSGARPQWLAQEYPSVLRTGADGRRAFFGHRHNHCYTSPDYRERVRIIDTKLAQRYGSHPAVIMWHISNEFGGECHCELCQEEFRSWLKKKYGTLDRLNHAWWTGFWSHTYTDWSQLRSPSWLGETSIHALDLDWQRFVTDRTIDFMKWEISAVKSVCPDIPVTANLMGLYCCELDYYKLGRELDIVSWDSYPAWHSGDDFITARNESLSHDMMRTIKDQPFLLMECTPSTTNWQPLSRHKRPGMHELSVMNAIAHGSDSAMYFQLRQSRGSAEKFHSAVISHTGTADTRIFREVSRTGRDIAALSDAVYGSTVPAQTAIIFDPENKWILDKIQGPRNAGLDYFGQLQDWYDYFFRSGINVDIPDPESELSGYRLIIAPMLYMFRSGIQDKLREFVRSGGILIATALTGTADSTDLCFTGEATEEKLSDVFGCWTEETDALDDGEYKDIFPDGRVKLLWERVRLTSGETAAEFHDPFFGDSPAVVKNRFGKGTAYRVCGAPDTAAIHKLIENALTENGCSMERAVNAPLPDGVSASYRVKDGRKLVFLQNFTPSLTEARLDGDYRDLLTGAVLSCTELPGYGFSVLEKL